MHEDAEVLSRKQEGSHDLCANQSKFGNLLLNAAGHFRNRCNRYSKYWRHSLTSIFAIAWIQFIFVFQLLLISYNSDMTLVTKVGDFYNGGLWGKSLFFCRIKLKFCSWLYEKRWHTSWKFQLEIISNKKSYRQKAFDKLIWNEQYIGATGIENTEDIR